MGEYSQGSFESPKELAYDLRQIYAKLVGEHLIDIAEHRKANNYYCWFKAIEDLKTITLMRWKEADKNIKLYDEIVKEVVTLSNNCPSVWKGENKNARDVAAIEAVLRKLEEFVYGKIDKLFGEQYNTRGL